MTTSGWLTDLLSVIGIRDYLWRMVCMVYLSLPDLVSFMYDIPRMTVLSDSSGGPQLVSPGGS